MMPAAVTAVSHIRIARLERRNALRISRRRADRRKKHGRKRAQFQTFARHTIHQSNHFLRISFVRIIHPSGEQRLSNSTKTAGYPLRPRRPRPLEAGLSTLAVSLINPPAAAAFPPRSSPYIAAPNDIPSSSPFTNRLTASDEPCILPHLLTLISISLLR